MRVSFSTTTSAFGADKYVASYVRDVRRNARRCSCDVQDNV
jgi:hypothetical protein